MREGLGMVVHTLQRGGSEFVMVFVGCGVGRGWGGYGSRQIGAWWLRFGGGGV